jgi:hypothetical protein
MANGGSHARGKLARHAGQARLGQVVVGLMEVLETPVVHIVPAIGAEAVDGERVAHLGHGIGQQHAGLPREAQHGVVLASHAFVGGLRQIQQHQHGNVARPAHAAHHDARVGLAPHALRHHRIERGIQVDLVAVLQLAQALHALRLHEPPAGTSCAL